MMENCYETFNSICRVCLKQNKAETMISLKEKPGKSSLTNYGKVLTRLAGISIDSEDYFPSKLCKKCKEMIRRIHSFTVLCKNNNRKLKRFAHLARNDGAKCKQLICEYTMFCQYFPIIPSSKRTIQNNVNLAVPSPIQFECNLTADNCDNDHSDSIELDNAQNYGDNIDLLLDSIENAVNTTMKVKPVKTKKVSTSESIDKVLDSIEKAVNTKIKYQRNKTKKTHATVKTKSYHCKICNRTLANRFTFSSHMQQHTNYQFICDQCGKGFPAKNSLNNHLLKKHDKGPFIQCSYCPLKCAKRFDLIEHIRIHTGERPFACEKCGLTFRRRAIWRNHLVQHKEKSVTCNICQKKFRRQRELSSHLNSVHERMFLYLCSVCDTSFAKNWSVRKHLLAKHGIPRDKQGKITRVTKDSNSLLFADSKSN